MMDTARESIATLEESGFYSVFQPSEQTERSKRRHKVIVGCCSREPLPRRRQEPMVRFKVPRRTLDPGWTLMP